MNEQTVADNAPLPVVNIPAPRTQVDIATILGLVLTISLIIIAIISGQSNANFFNLPAILIVILGTMTATCISYTFEELGQGAPIIARSIINNIFPIKRLSTSLIDLAVIAKKRGLLVLSNYESDLNKHPFLSKAIQMTVDGYAPEAVTRLLNNEIEAMNERRENAVSIIKRASEIAPAMGLIGTLVGLVQMLADLENPETLGPAMAVAILTTLYGAILGMVILASLAGKMEKNARDEKLIYTLFAITASSIAKHENPRQLEMLMNAELPAAQRIEYFD